jgi:hypothetical protein
MSFRVSCKVFPKERKNYRRPLHRPQPILRHDSRQTGMTLARPSLSEKRRTRRYRSLGSSSEAPAEGSDSVPRGTPRRSLCSNVFGSWSDCRDLTGDWQEIAKRPTLDLL